MGPEGDDQREVQPSRGGATRAATVSEIEALRALERHPGWRLYLAWLERQIEAGRRRALDPDTSDEECRRARVELAKLDEVKGWLGAALSARHRRMGSRAGR